MKYTFLEIFGFVVKLVYKNQFNSKYFGDHKI